MCYTVVGCQACGTGGCEFPDCHSHVANVSILVGYSWTFWALKVRPLGCLKMSETNYPVTWHQITRTKTLFSRVFLWGIFAKLWKATTSCLSVCPTIHIEQLVAHQEDSHEIWYLGIFRKSVKKIQVALQLDKNDKYFTWLSRYIFILLSAS
jgi:hypothetical protein